MTVVIAWINKIFARADRSSYGDDTLSTNFDAFSHGARLRDTWANVAKFLMMWLDVALI